MLVRSFTVENYRSFGRPTTVELRKINLLFGHNSSGKSTLVRVLPLIAESIREGGAPLHLSGEAGRSASWTDLICQVEPRRAVVKLGLRLQADDGSETPRALGELHYALRGDDENRSHFVERLTLTAPPGPGGEGRREEVLGDEPTPARRSSFRSLVPTAPHPGFEALIEALKTLPDQVVWVSGLRARPEREFRLSGYPDRRMAADGQDAAELVVLNEGTLRPKLQGYFNRLDQTLHVSPFSRGLYALELSPSKALGVKVNLVDTGEGHAQVLPVLVALARASVAKVGQLVALEQPELHLHTRAQLALADQLVETVHNNPSARLLVETHSEVLMSAVQLAVAEGRLSPDDVTIFWVGQRADGQGELIPVQLDELGRPTSTALMGMFDEPAKLGRQLLKARAGRRP